ncbi:MAG: AsnC family transcriptional regulator [archaeon]
MEDFILISKRLEEEWQLSPTKLDVKDKKIISLLSNDCRMPLSQIRKQAALSRDSVKYRIKRMQRQGLIQAFIPQINFRAFGFYDFHVFVTLDEKDQKKKSDFIFFLKSLSYVREVIEYSDKYDLEIIVLSKSIEDFDVKLSEITKKYPDIILQNEKMIVIKGYLSSHSPKIIHKDSGIQVIRRFKPPIPFIPDKTDISILEALSGDARMPYHNIGKRVGITGEGVKYRVKRLLHNRVIREFTIMLNFTRLGYHWYTLLLKTKKFEQSHEQKMMKFAYNNLFVIKAVKCLGAWDFILYILADSHRHFHGTVNIIKNEFSDIITAHESLLAYKEHFYKPLPKIINITKES